MCVVYFLLAQGGITPLHIASLKGRSDIVNILVRNGANVNNARQVRYSLHKMCVKDDCIL